MKVHLRDQVKDSTGILRDLIKDSNWNFSPGTLFNFLMSLTQEKELCLDSLFHFLIGLTQDKELCSYSLFQFLMNLTQDKQLCSKDLFHFLMRLTQ